MRALYRGRGGAFALLGIILVQLFIPSTVWALDQWRCVVEDFKGHGDQPVDFVDANLKKRFSLTVTDIEVLVKMTSKDFEGAEERYKFFFSDSTDLHAMTDSIVSLDTLSLPRHPENDLAKDGFFNVTIAIHSNFFVNSWLLRCVE